MISVGFCSTVHNTIKDLLLIIIIIYNNTKTLQKSFSYPSFFVCYIQLACLKGGQRDR